MTSVKLRTSWTDNNVVIEGVRIYKSNQAFTVETRPQPLVEITNGFLFYEDFDVEPGQTWYYMLSCFLAEQEVFTECFEVEIIKDYVPLNFVSCEESSVGLSGGTINKNFVNQVGDLLILISNTNQEYTSDVVGSPPGFVLIDRLGGAYVYGKIATSANEYISRTFASGGGCFLVSLRASGSFTSFGVDSSIKYEVKTGSSSSISGAFQTFNSGVSSGGDLYAVKYSQQESLSYTPGLTIQDKAFTKKSSSFSNNMALAGAINSSPSIGGDAYTLTSVYAQSNSITTMIARVWVR